MSMEQEVKLKCNNCGKESSFVIWNSLNTQLNPKEKEKVMDGSLFEFTCPYCNDTAIVQYNILYHQMEDEIMIQCIVDGDEDFLRETYEVFADEIDDPENILSKSGISTKYRKRIVGSYNELREKIMIFDAGLDDRVIDIIKLIYIIMSEDTSFEQILFDNRDTDFGAMIFFKEGKPVAKTEFIKEFYDKIKNDYNELIEKHSEKEFIFGIKWANKVVLEREKQNQ